ncbi:MAG: hypothetical protein JEZ12_27920 [Desulfobacterium sp.]|nr:hypothetical protein [Desulfobacterium sp.]
MIFKLGDSLELNLKDDDPVVEIKVDGGKGVVAIARDGAIIIESQADINMTGSINIEASGELNLKGSVINLN